MRDMYAISVSREANLAMIPVPKPESLVLVRTVAALVAPSARDLPGNIISQKAGCWALSRTSLHMFLFIGTSDPMPSRILPHQLIHEDREAQLHK